MSGRGVERVLDLIEWFAVSPGPASLSQVVTALGLPKSSTLLMLRSLTERGYLERLDNGAYGLLRLPGDISADRQNHGALLALAAPYISTAVEETQESGFLAVIEGDAVRYLNKIMPPREIRYDRDISMTRPAHRVASGIVILAAGSDTALQAYASGAGLTQEEVRTLTQMVDLTRRDGVCLNLNGVVEGAAGAAAAILDAQGRPVGAINIAGPQVRMAGSSDRVCDVVRTTARAVSEELSRRTTRSS